MNIKETEEYLIMIGIPQGLYAINSLGNGDCAAITHNYEPNEGWAVFYSERGNRFFIKKFPSEEAACDFFIQTVIENTKHSFDSFERQRINGYTSP